MGPATRELSRIGVLYCIDGMPAFKPHGLSLKPAEFMLLSLPPWERSRPENMLLHMLMPSKLKKTAMKKYFDWSAVFELTNLAEVGIDGVKILQFGNSLDTPGRSEFLQMQASQSYQGCPHCFHSWVKGLVRKPIFNGAMFFAARVTLSCSKFCGGWSEILLQGRGNEGPTESAKYTDGRRLLHFGNVQETLLWTQGFPHAKHLAWIRLGLEHMRVDA